MSKTMNVIQNSTPGMDRRWVVGATVGSILSAFAASACCLGPLVFGLLGIGGAGLLAKFEPYRPYFSAGTFALLGAGFYFTYRRPKPSSQVGNDACGCETPGVNRAGRVVLWIAATVSVGFLVYPYVAGILTHCG